MLNHLFVVARRRRLEDLEFRARISCRSRTVPRLLAWTAAMPSQAFACVLEVSLPSAVPCPGWRQSKDHPSSFLSLDLFVVLSDQSITRDRKGKWCCPRRQDPLARRCSSRSRFDPGCSRCWPALSLTDRRPPTMLACRTAPVRRNRNFTPRLKRGRASNFCR